MPAAPNLLLRPLPAPGWRRLSLPQKPERLSMQRRLVALQRRDEPDALVVDEVAVLAAVQPGVELGFPIFDGQWRGVLTA